MEEPKSTTSTPANLTFTSFVQKHYPKLLLLFLLLTAGVVIYHRFWIQVAPPENSDVYPLLINALHFAGKGVGYAELYLPPLLSILTSLIFRAGFVSIRALFITDAVVSLAGIIGLYYLLKQRFSPLLSLLGALLFLAFPAVYSWVATGMTDVPGAAMSILTILLFVLAADKDSRFYILAWPAALVMILTRYNSLLMIIPIALLLILRGNILRGLKNILVGLGITTLIALPYFYMNIKEFSDPVLPFVGVFGAVTSGALRELHPVLNRAWYVQNLPSFVLPAKYIFLFWPLAALVVAGLSVYTLRVVRGRGFSLSLLAKFLILGALLVGYAFIFAKGGALPIRTLLIFTICLLTYYFFETHSESGKFLWLDVAVLAWLWVNWDFHSNLLELVRYSVSMLAPLAYFVVLGIDSLIGLLKHSKAASLIAKITATVTLATLIGASFTCSLQVPRRAEDKLNTSMTRAVAWLKANVPNIETKTIFWSSSWRAFLSWHTRQNARGMPAFKDERAYEHELQKHKADYYVEISQAENYRYLHSYKLFKKLFYKNYSTFILSKKPGAVQGKPRVLYIGQNWQNYIEEVLGFQYFVFHKSQRYGYKLNKAQYLDEYSLRELKQFPMILLYNFRWHNRQDAEAMLASYLEDGGTVIVDATANVTGVGTLYNLDDQDFLGIKIQKKALSRNPSITLKSALQSEPVVFSPFTTGRSTWIGATYQGSREHTLKPLATADGNVLIGEQKIGKGKVYWIGYNLVWHAFETDNREEQRLLQKLWELAASSNER